MKVVMTMLILDKNMSSFSNILIIIIYSPGYSWYVRMFRTSSTNGFVFNPINFFTRYTRFFFKFPIPRFLSILCWFVSWALGFLMMSVSALRLLWAVSRLTVYARFNIHNMTPPNSNFLQTWPITMVAKYLGTPSWSISVRGCTHFICLYCF